jgi:predicted DCC family thiol-disulfide oxidoreductase YuxK
VERAAATPADKRRHVSMTMVRDSRDQSETEKVILFDGVCKLCSAWARFLIRFDNNRRIKLGHVQSESGQAILMTYGFPTDHFYTMLFIDG